MGSKDAVRETADAIADVEAGTRIRSLRSRKQLANMTFIRALVYFLYFLGIAFVTSAATLESGLDLSTLGSCRAAIYICLLFYVGSKVVMQIFLVERAHAIRYKLKRRMDDYVWLVGILIVLFGFGSIAIVAFISPIADIARSDGKCRIGLPLKVTIPLLTYDILINVAMTFVFVALLRPLLRFRTPPDGRGPTVVVKHDPKKPGTIVRPLSFSQIRSCRSSAAIHSMSAQSIELQDAPPPRDVVINPQLRILKRLVMKSLLGAVAVLVPTIVNLGLLYHWSGEEQGWLCFTICTCDGELLTRYSRCPCKC